VAVLALYLNALPGNGAHLSRSTTTWPAATLSDGHVSPGSGSPSLHDDTEPGTPERRAAYLCDITYGTNNEFGSTTCGTTWFFPLEQRVQRVHLRIIDEVDSILIDEARTPLIISGPVGNEADTKYAEHNQAVLTLVRRQSEVANNSSRRPRSSGPRTSTPAPSRRSRSSLACRSTSVAEVLQELGAKKLVQRVELDYIADRKLPAKQQKTARTRGGAVFRPGRERALGPPDRPGVELGCRRRTPALFIVPDLSEEVLKIDRDEALSAHDKLERRGQLEADYAAKSEKLNIIHQLLRAHALYEKDVEYSCRTGRSLSWTSSPAASCPAAAGRTGCTRRSRRRKACR